MKIKKFLVGFFMLSLFAIAPISLTSCTSDNNGGENENYVTLTSDEQSVYNSIVGSLESFKDPSSVILTWVSEEPLIGGRYVKINAKNSLGGYVVGSYQCNGYSLRSVDRVVGDSDYSINISNINHKLNEYKASMGW